MGRFVYTPQRPQLLSGETSRPSTPPPLIPLDSSNAIASPKNNSRTVVGVDVNEDNVTLTTLSEDGIEDPLIPTGLALEPFFVAVRSLRMFTDGQGGCHGA